MQQRNPQAFAFATARAVIRFFGAQVELNLLVRQITVFHPHLRQRLAAKTGVLAHHGHGGLKNHGLAAHAAQLRGGACMVARFTQALAIEVCHLVTANHNAARKLRGHCARLGKCQAARQCGGGLASLGRFVHAGRGNGKGKAQAFEQLAAVDRGRAQNEGAGKG